MDFRFEGGGGASFDLKLGKLYLAALAGTRSHPQDSPPDLIHCWMYHGGRVYWSALAGRGTNRPARVGEIHHSPQDIRNEKRSRNAVLQLLSALTRRPEAINCCSELSRRQHTAIVFALDCAVFVSNTVDTKIFLSQPDARANFPGICREPVTHGLAVNLAESISMKDHHAVVRVAVRLMSWNCDVQVVLFDEGHGDRPVISEAENLGTAGRLTAPDLLDGVDALVPGLDVFLLCSAWGEAFPLAVTEAMVAGVTCVVTDVGRLCARGWKNGAGGAAKRPRGAG
ncbi:glycosyltransferase [Aliiruegeria lutimaris]|uniref:glycosyltransferase n=1 Tax=Aliiruegeria lutimaris TaxID=571298 RepID=UPI00147E3B01|nr:glycosyltransferase [Aliiruegeria lutimaris]